MMIALIMLLLLFSALLPAVAEWMNARRVRAVAAGRPMMTKLSEPEVSAEKMAMTKVSESHTDDRAVATVSASEATPAIVEMVPLPYGMADLAPAIGRETMEYHYGKHYHTYVENVCRLAAGTALADEPLTRILRLATPGALLNNAGQAYNHALYFLQFSPKPAAMHPHGSLAEAIRRDFGSDEAFRSRFAESVLSLFGSGWTWLYADVGGKLFVGNYPNGENPLMYGMAPLFCVDCWEHAYYLDHRNRRADHLAALWRITDWNVIARRYEKR